MSSAKSNGERDYKAIYAERKARGEFDRHKGVPTMIRLSEHLHQRLVIEAVERERSIAWMVSKLVEEGLERLIPVEEMTLTRPEKRS